MTKPIDSLKMDIIASLSMLNDYEKLLSISRSLHRDVHQQPSIFNIGSVNIESIESFDSIYKSQGSKQILFAELPICNEDWGFSLDEILTLSK